MPRKLAEAAPLLTDGASTEAPQEKLPAKIDLTDANAIKHTLDATASDVVLHSGYTEDHLINNVKNALGVFAIGSAAYSHFGPGRFPANWDTVFYCVAAYIMTNIVLFVFCLVKERDSFLITLPKPGHEYGLRVSSRMDRLAESYTLLICAANKWEDREVKLEAPVTEYFHEDGYLADGRFRNRVAKLLGQYEQLDADSDLVTPRPKALNPKKQQKVH